MISIIIIILVLAIIILVHELGHFIAAKKSGLVVEEFGFGFPPRLFSIKKGGTIYSLNLLPLGGFVKILGEDGSQNENINSFSSKSIG
ncbi:MAG: site-2 protease family protein, partial [Spirochaetota bacterium]